MSAGESAGTTRLRRLRRVCGALVVACFGMVLANASPARAGTSTGNGLLAYDCGSQICVVNPDGLGERTLPLPSGTSKAAHPHWSPDGLKLVFEAQAGSSWEIFTSNP